MTEATIPADDLSAELSAAARAWSALTSHLEARARELDDEVRHYPTPIARCDVQLTKLLEQRSHAVDELKRLDACRPTRAAGDAWLAGFARYLSASQPDPEDDVERTLREKAQSAVNGLGSHAADAPRIVNLAELPWQRWWRNDRIGVEYKDPARHLGSQIAGLRIERLAPGKQSSPLHRHLVQEELFLILNGTGILRHGDRQVPVKPGDFIVYRAGDPAAHSFINTGTEPLEFIATGNRVAYEVCEYPEDGTVYVEAIDKTLRAEEVTGTREVVERWRTAPE